MTLQDLLPGVMTISWQQVVMIAVGLTLIYLAIRFDWRFGLAAVLSTSHDILVTMAFIKLLNIEVSLTVVAAILTLLGYSANDTIIIFDRVRETFRRFRKLNTEQVIDHAITSTMSRTIITHGSTQMMVLSMLIFGGETLHYFSLALTIGILFGIYSSVLVASPLVMWLGVSREQFIAKQKKIVEGANEEGAVV